MNKKQILDFIKKQRLAVLSTVNKEGNPQSAVLEFGETNDFEIIIDTLKTSRKYRNIIENPNVSLVIGWDEDITVQYEGVASELEEDEKEEYQEIYWKKNPKAKKWAKEEGIVYFKITPKWLRFSDLNVHPWKIDEFTFNTWNLKSRKPKK